MIGRRCLAAGSAWAVGLGVATVAAATMVPAQPAAAATGDYKVTVVARYCPDSAGTAYLNVRANRARNNIMEMLKNLGPDSNYTNDMNPPVNPTNELAPPQDVCDPLNNFPVTFGDKISGMAPLPQNGSSQPYLSKVGNASGTYRTEASVPLLNSAGQPTGQQIEGAHTVSLTDAQATLAGKNSLWVMGGTTANGLGDASAQFPPKELQFAALRCGVDALNGDNVEWVGYRNGAKHTFCYAIYIHDDAPPPPTPGQITIRKSAPGAGDQSFGFQGDISFNPGGTFSLKDGGIFSETRAPGDWYVIEKSLPDGWTLDDITCEPLGASTVTRYRDRRRLEMTLAEAGSIDCTFVNNPPPPPSEVTVAKVTYGKTGTFPFRVTGPVGFDESFDLTTTNAEGEDPVLEGFDSLDAGTYTMTETLPTDPTGTWTVTDVECRDVTDTVLLSTKGTADTEYQVTVKPGQKFQCTWTNTFTPRGSLIIRAKTIGGTNDAINYLIPVWNPGTGQCDILDPLYDQDADTTTAGEGVFAVALPQSTLDQPTKVYCIAGTRPTEGAEPAWVTKSVKCTGDIDYDQPFNTDPNFTAAIVAPKPGGTVTCDFVYVKRGTVNVAKTVEAEDPGARDGPVTVELNCPASAQADPSAWPKTLTVPTSATTGNLWDDVNAGKPIYVDGDAEGKDSCYATETAKGAAQPQDPGAIDVTWKGDNWPKPDVKSLPDTKTAVVSATSTNSNPVSSSVASGPCTLAGGTLTANGSAGQCVLGFEADGNPGVVRVNTQWQTAVNDVPGPRTDGDGGQVTKVESAAGQAIDFSFFDSYRQDIPKITTDRVVDLQSLPQVTVTKTITGGADLRDKPVVVELQCTNSAAADPAAWPKVLTVPVGQDSGSLTVTVPGDANASDTCSATERANGAAAAGEPVTILPKWNAKDWVSGARSLAFQNSASLAGATASNGSAVSVDLSKGQCTLKGDKLTAQSGTGDCQLRYSAPANPGATQTTTSWSVSTPAVSGNGEKTSAFPVAADGSSAVAFQNVYTRSTGTVTTDRTVTLNRVSPETQCDPTKPRRAGNTAVVDCGRKTPQGQKIRYKATCTPLKSSAQGERKYCKVRVTKKGKVIVRTYGQPTKVRVTARVKATKNAKAWKKTWIWRVK